MMNDTDDEDYLMEINRMVNEGLGGGEVTIDNGYIGEIPLEQLLEDSERE
ncbi:hypothetical protein [Paenibacillus crassostreae]|nr:hypothetical protein [Paenibacillus crassostreae]